jgi:hypothetical protein
VNKGMAIDDTCVSSIDKGCANGMMICEAVSWECDYDDIPGDGDDLTDCEHQSISGDGTTTLSISWN